MMYFKKPAAMSFHKQYIECKFPLNLIYLDTCCKEDVFAGLVLDLANSEYQCLPTGKHSSTRGPNGNNFTIGQNIGILVAILVGLRFFTFFLLQAAYKLKKL